MPRLPLLTAAALGVAVVGCGGADKQEARTTPAPGYQQSQSRVAVGSGAKAASDRARGAGLDFKAEQHTDTPTVLGP